MDNENAYHWDSIRWEFEDDDIHWILVPDSTTQPIGLNCKVYVLEQINDTIWLRAKVYNKCAPEGIERRYWLLCSFYGIEENDPSTESGTESRAFNVTPNPNNGQMQLNFENLIGKIDLKVFDSRGTLIDQFNVNSETRSYSLPYEYKSQAEGLYLFVATWKNTVLTKKVIFFQ